MALDRASTLKNAEEFLRGGRLDAAIGEYARILEAQPDDWTTANALGDLHLRAGQADKAVDLYQQVADHHFAEGFYPKAGALLKKIIKIRPDDEGVRLRLGDIAARQGLISEARKSYAAVLARRKERSDASGADEVVARLGLLDPADTEARLEGARALERRGDRPAAIERYRQLSQDLLAEPSAADADECVLAIAERVLACGERSVANGILQRIAEAAPGRITTLLRLVEIGVDADLHAVVHAAQAGMADVYLREGRAEEARVIAEDLVTRDRSDAAHVERLRRALELLGVAGIDRLIAERVNATVADPLAFLEDEFTATRTDLAGPSRAVQREPSSAPTPAPSSVPVIDLTGVPLELQHAAPEPVPAPPELDEVFAGIRAEADADPVVDESEDYATLARNYIDMGAIQDAIDALRHAVKSPKQRFVCASMLARLYRDTSDIPRAIEWYERAAEAPPSNPEDGARLMYDLGDLLETMGEYARALAVFIEIDADAAGCLDIHERIARLSDRVGG